MAELKKLLVYPRKPKAGASEEEILDWQIQRDFVKNENAKIKAHNEKIKSGEDVSKNDTRSKLKRIQNRK